MDNFDKYVYRPIPEGEGGMHDVCGPCDCGYDHCPQAKGGPDELPINQPD